MEVPLGEKGGPRRRPDGDNEDDGGQTRVQTRVGVRQAVDGTVHNPVEESRVQRTTWCPGTQPPIKFKKTRRKMKRHKRSSRHYKFVDLLFLNTKLHLIS